MLKQLPVVHGAAFDSYGHEHGSICLPNTRVELPRQIANWADDFSAESIFWLNGMAGTGKSTILVLSLRYLPKKFTLVRVSSPIEEKLTGGTWPNLSRQSRAVWRRENPPL